MIVCLLTLSILKVDNHLSFSNSTAELSGVADDSYFPKSVGFIFRKIVGFDFSEIC